MKNWVLKVLKSPYFAVLAVYFLAHFFMLLLSGCWWDDWTFMSHDLNYINIVASESGRPEWNFLVPLCWSLPNNGRILIFFLYMFISLFVYTAVKESTLFDEKESLIIALLFSVVPVDEARILISNFAYTVGLFFFYLSFMLFMIWNKMENGTKKKVYRFILLCLFFLGFLLNSVLAYYYILIAYLFVLEMRDSDEKNFFKRVFISVKNVLFYYPDFFILPFVYYGFNKIFFPTYGETFGSYNSVTLDGLFKCFLYIPISVVKIFLDIFKKCMSCINAYTLIVLIVVLVIAIFAKDELKEKKKSFLEIFLELVYGAFVLVMAVFPYVMVRGRAIDTMGVKGRDAVLAPLGLAMILFAFSEFLHGKAKKIFLSLLITFGIIGMNSLYLEWQKDYYYQLSIQNLMDDPFIEANDTFFFSDVNETEVQGQRYYSINALAVNVYGDQTRFFVPKVSDIYIMGSEYWMKEAKEALGSSHLMRDYEPDDYCFDAVLNYKNDLSWKDVIRLKCMELFDKESFDDFITNSGTMDIIEVEDDFTKLLLERYNSGDLKRDQDVLDLLPDYGG